ncbi:MAG: FmdB family zinc ribbon protein [Opitutales bacterium]
MPTYDYTCSACNAALEIFQSMRDDPLKKCPECGKPALKRMIGTGAGILFKGSGFYETDYKRPAEKTADSGGGDAKDGKPSSESGSSSEAAKTISPAKKTDKAKVD